MQFVFYQIIVSLLDDDNRNVFKNFNIYRIGNKITVTGIAQNI